MIVVGEDHRTDPDVKDPIFNDNAIRLYEQIRDGDANLGTKNKEQMVLLLCNYDGYPE